MIVFTSTPYFFFSCVRMGNWKISILINKSLSIKESIIMAINSKQAKDIDAYISAKGKNCLRGKQKVEINGKIEVLDTYMIPITYLSYNHNNGRFNLEINEFETQIKRKLDPNISEDVIKIKELLLQDKIEAEKLYEDLKLIGEQREVAAITWDGVVVNGNRRMATFELLNQEEPTGKWTELWVVRLPQHISEKDLWRIEAGLQLSKEKVADYGPVNNLLMIKEGKIAGLTPKEIAASMYGWNEKQVITDLERLDLIDIFLQFFGQPNNYGLIKTFRLSEHFIDIQKGLVQRLKDAQVPKKEISNKLKVIFLYLYANITKPDLINITHYDIRNICKILQDTKASAALTDTFDNFKEIKKVPIEKLIDNLDKATDVKKNKEDEQKPGKLIERAITALNGINRKGKSFVEDEQVKNKMIELDKIVNDIKKQLGIS